MNKIQDIGPSIHSRDEAFEILKPHIPTIAACIADGWNAWGQLGTVAPEIRKPLSKACRARFVYDHIVDSAKRRFHKAEGVTISMKRGFLALSIQPGILFRFKKLGRNLRSSGIPTQQYLRFIQQIVIPGFEVTNLIGGYRLNDLESTIADMHITCPVGASNQWVMEISADRIPESIATFVPDTLEAKTVVRPVESKESKKKSG